jgi:hypothetical protein
LAKPLGSTCCRKRWRKVSAKRVGRQILECALPFTDLATVDYPVLPPGFIRNLCQQFLLAQAVPHLAPKKPGQRFDVDEEVILGAHPALAIGR